MIFDLQLANQRALVTGGTKGVGAAVVETLLNAGVRRNSCLAGTKVGADASRCS